jgi:hypothetical protein
MLNKFNSLSKGDRNITSAFGYNAVSINGLTIYTFKMRTMKGSLLDMAFHYVSTREAEIPVMISSVREKNHRTYITYKYATTDSRVAAAVTKAWETASGYVLMHKADMKLGTKNAPNFSAWYYGIDMDSDSLPF